MRRPAIEGSHTGQLIAGILLAAGLSTRFGRQKLLEPWQGEALVRRSARAFIEARLLPVVAVVSSDRRFAHALAGLTVTTTVNRDPAKGISSSIACGLGALPDAVDAALIGVADQPNLDPSAIAALMAAFAPGRIVVPRFDDHRGNPVIFDRRFFSELLALSGDVGGQLVVMHHPEAIIEVPLDRAIGDDIDRPEDWHG